MLLNRKFFIAIIIAFILYTLVLVFFFKSNIDYSFDIFHITKQKELVSLSLSYNKKLYDMGNEKQKKELLDEYAFINEQQAYLALLDFFRKKIITGIVVSTVILSGVSILILFTALLFLVRQMLYPFQRVISTLDGYLRNRKIEKIKPRGNKEIRNFLSDFNGLMDKLVLSRAEEKIKSSFQNWQTLAKIIVHEIKNQISPVNLNIESLIYYNEEIQLKKGLENIRNNLDSIEKIVNNFRNLSNLPEPVCSHQIIIDLARQSAEKLNIPEKNIVYLNENENFTVYSDKFYLDLIFINLLKNAKESTDESVLKISIEFLKDKKIKIIDNGPGIPEETLPKIFKPGFTTKSGGDGIGLFLVKELCNCLGVTLNIESSASSGTTAILDFSNT